MVTRLHCEGTVTADLTAAGVNYGVAANIPLTTTLGGLGVSLIQPNDNIVVRRIELRFGLGLPMPAVPPGPFWGTVALRARNAEVPDPDDLIYESPFLPVVRDLERYFAWPASYLLPYEIVIPMAHYWTVPMIGVPATLDGTEITWYVGVDIEHTQELT